MYYVLLNGRSNLLTVQVTYMENYRGQLRIDRFLSLIATGLVTGIIVAYLNIVVDLILYAYGLYTK